MTRVQADPALKDALTRNGERVEVCDETGRVIGYALTPAEMQTVEKARRTLAGIYAEADATFDAEEHRKTLDDPRKYTTEEFLTKLGLP
jgi:hypothetical protein